MNVTIEDVSACRKRLKVEVPSDRVNAEFEKISDEFHKEAKLPGFRAGKAPKSMILKRFSQDIDEETKRKLLPKAYYEVVDQKKLNVVSAPQFEEVKYQRGMTMSFSTTVDLAPEFALPSYKGIEVKKGDETVKDEEIEKSLKSLVTMRSKFENVTGRGLQLEDFAVITFTGVSEGKPIKEIVPDERLLGGAEKFWLRMHVDEFVPGFVTALLGLNIGEKRTVDLELPADFRVEVLKGKKVSYDVELHEIKEQKLPEITDEIAKEFGLENVETLRAKVKESLEENAKRQIDGERRNTIIQKLLESVNFDLPESWVQDETRDVVYQIVSENQSRGITPGVLEEKKQEIFENASRTAKDRVKLQFIVQKIAEAESIKIEESDVSQEVFRLAQQNQTTPEKIAKRLAEPGVYYSLRQQITTRKVLDFLVKEAKISES